MVRLYLVKSLPFLNILFQGKKQLFKREIITLSSLKLLTIFFFSFCYKQTINLLKIKVDLGSGCTQHLGKKSKSNAGLEQNIIIVYFSFFLSFSFFNDIFFHCCNGRNQCSVIDDGPDLIKDSKTILLLTL